ncbi:MAG: glutamate formimidoyltransferase [Candidatus Marinimicrobia bacterium]|nr:glutamate formimidoyltransferase [Candidatus Neomarinimicrobiota bacterium]
MVQLVECIPNISEGREKAAIDKIVNAIKSVNGVYVLDVYSDQDTNRTVITFVGNIDGIFKASFDCIKKAIELIDMRFHNGIHPRIGAVDVFPIVPITGVSINKCIEVSHRLAKMVSDELDIPVYLYEKSAQFPQRVKLENIRRGGYEKLAEKIIKPEWYPDYGKPVFVPKSGAIVMGVREPLIAYNINLNTKDKRIADEIAGEIRESGNAINQLAEGNKRRPGLFKSVKAIGWYREELGITQVSTNITDYRIAPLHKVYLEVERKAKEKGVELFGSEIVGLVPKEAIISAGLYFLGKSNEEKNSIQEKEIINAAVKGLCLNKWNMFKPEEKILEYKIEKITGIKI